MLTRIDVYRAFSSPEKLVAAAYGHSKGGEMRVLALEVGANDESYSMNESDFRTRIEPTLRLLWDMEDADAV